MNLELRNVRINWANVKPHDNVNFVNKKIIFTNEAHFLRGGYINKQNYCIWSSKNPHVALQQPIYPLQDTAWCAFAYISLKINSI